MQMGKSVALLSFVVKIGFVYSSPTLTVPTAGNCGDDTVLTCHVTGSIGSTGWNGLNRDLVLDGDVVRPEDSNKYTETRGTTSFTLTIHNTNITDQGEYRCKNGFSPSQFVQLNFECKASSAVSTVTNGKRLTVSVDKLYPSSPTFSVSFKEETGVVNISGSRTCSNSTKYPGYYKCVWSSSYSLADGFYTYSIVVTTITQADPVTGSFKIVPPKPPEVANTVTLSSGNIAVYGNEGQSLTIHCTSTGGYPTPTLVWYKGSVSSSNQLASTSTGILQTNGTYTVTLQHRLTPTLADDRKIVICRSYYPDAEVAFRGSKTTSVILYLSLKPSDPTVVQITDVTAGGTVGVRCRTTGSRPAANITWSYQGATYTGTVTSTFNKDTETYTVVSEYMRRVTAADNGRNIQCVVTHPALVSSSGKNASININVQFSVQASSTSITGNREMTATGTATLALNCTTGSSNPASDITWKNGSVTITNDRPYTETTGENNGVVRSQHLVLTTTRYMDGDVITCSVSNSVSQSPVTDMTTLDLRYRPIIEPMQDQVTVEGNVTVLSCKASSKPASTFRWYRQGQNNVIHEGTGTLDKNQLPYTINNTRRTHAGTYRCEADNEIEIADTKSMSLTVNYPPDVNVLTKNTTVKAESVLLTCNTSGVANSQYKYGKWIQKWPGTDVIVKEYNGSPSLVLDLLTYEHSGVYSCSASNGIKVFGTNKEYMEGSVQLLVKSYPVILNVTEKVPARLKEAITIDIDYYSNIENSDVKCHKSVNGSRQSKFIVAQRYDNVKVNLPVFSHSIRTNGTRAVVRITIDSKEDFGLYDVIVSNNIDASLRTVEIVPRGVASFFLDGHKGQTLVTVDEHDGVELICVSDNPVTAITIMFEDQTIKEALATKSVTVVRSNVECFHAGVYTCVLRDADGKSTSLNISLFVRCSPRPLRQTGWNMTNAMYVPVTLSFTVLAYPEPGVKGFSWYKENGKRWIRLLTNKDIQISSSTLQSNLTIRNVSSTDYGQYRVIATNTIGVYEQYYFLAKKSGTSTDVSNSRSDKTAIIIGPVLGSMCLIFVIYSTYLTILHRRKTKSADNKKSNGQSTLNTYVNLAYKSRIHEKREDEQRKNITDNRNLVDDSLSSQYTDLTRFRDDRTPYDIIHTN